MEQNSARCKRWFEIVLLALIAAAVGFVLDGVLTDWMATVQRFFAGWPATSIPILLVVLLSPIAVIVVHLRGLAIGHWGGWGTWLLRCGGCPLLLLYPPTCLAVPLAGIVIWLLSHWAHPARPALGYPSEVWVWAACVLLAATLWALLGSALLLRGERSEPRSSPSIIESLVPTTPDATLRAFRDNPETLIRWLAREEPIDRPDRDLFGARTRAVRLARRLFETPLQTFGIVGPRGAGKTSLCKLVEHELTSTGSAMAQEERDGPHAPVGPGRVWTCWVDAWGLNSGAGAAEYVLSQVVNELAEHVDCMAIAGLPAHYRAALAEGGSAWGKTFGALLGRSQSPLDLLRQLDPILAAVDRRLVIFIEDLERNPHDEGLFRQMEAMLDRLRQVERVTFVLAVSEAETAEQRTLIDFTRLCDRTEVLPEFDPWMTWQVLEAFRTHCLTCFAEGPNADIDPAPPTAREALGPLDELRWTYGGGREPWTFVPRQLAALIATPRMLKQTLRRTWQAWRALHGEVDFDDLLTCNILRFASEPTYSFLLSHIRQIRDLPVEDEGGKTAEDVERARQALMGMMLGRPRAGVSPETLVSFLFPAWSDRSVPRRLPVPQGVAVSEPTDYWARINAESVEAEIRDQDVLRTMRDSRTDGPERVALIERLAQDEAFSLKFEQFASRNLSPVVDLDGDGIRGLATDLFALVLDRSGAAAAAQSVPGYFALWRSLHRKHGSGDHAAWLAEEARKALSRSLGFAVELVYYWGEVKYGLLDAAGQAAVHRSLVEHGRELFAADPARLVSVLHPSDPASIIRLAVPPDVAPASDVSLPWLGATLLARRASTGICSSRRSVIYCPRARGNGYSRPQVSPAMFKPFIGCRTNASACSSPAPESAFKCWSSSPEVQRSPTWMARQRTWSKCSALRRSVVLHRQCMINAMAAIAQ